MPRPPSGKPYVCGPVKHRRKWRLVIYTPRGPGRRSTYIRSFVTEAEAKTWKREFQRTAAAAGRTVNDAVVEYLDAYLRKRKGNKEGSIATSRHRLAAILDFDMPLGDLTPRRAEDLYEQMIDEGYGKDRTYAPDTHHNSLMEAKAFARYCMSKSWLSNNPFAKIEPVGKKRHRKKQLRIDEARTYIGHCMGEWQRTKDRTAIAALLPLAFNLRASEVAQLVARDVDDRGRLLWVAYGEDEAGQDLAKTASSRRAAKVPKHLVQPLRELADTPALATGHLFANEDGKPATRHWVRYWVLAHAKAAKVPPITTHGLRGTHASIGVGGGVADTVMAAALGHDVRDEGATARRHYIDPAVAADAQDARAADSLFDGIPEPVDSETTPRVTKTKSGIQNEEV